MEGETTTPAPVAAEPAPASAEPAPIAAPAPVVDMLGEDLAGQYPSLKEMEDAEAKGLKFPVERAWLDEQMKDSKFRAFANGLRGMATKEREVTVSEKKAIQADREALAAEYARGRSESQAVQAELSKLRALVEKIPGAPPKPAGGEPDPKDPNPKVQAYYAQKYVASMFDPMRAEFAKLSEQQVVAEQKAEVDRLTVANQAFISKTSDYAAYHEQVMALLTSGEATTPEAAYYVAKARVLATASPAASAATTGPDLSKMSATDVTVYAMEHPEWKLPTNWKQLMRFDTPKK